MGGPFGRRRGRLALASALALLGAAAIALTASAGTTSYSYDALGRVTEATLSDGTQITYTYDNDGNRTQQVIQSGSGGSNPVAVNDSISTSENTAVSFDPRTNDSDPNGYSLSVSAVTNGAHGTVTNHTTYVTYTPTSGYSGTDSFTYTDSNGHGGTSNAATVSVSVGAAGPTAVADTFTVHGTAIPGYNGYSMGCYAALTNDISPGGYTLSISSVTQPTYATGYHSQSYVSGNQVCYYSTMVGTFTDYFTYTISDGHGGSSTATETVNVVYP